MKEIAEAEENEATKGKKQGGSSRQRENAMESVFTTKDHYGDYDDFVSFNFDNY